MAGVSAHAAGQLPHHPGVGAGALGRCGAGGTVCGGELLGVRGAVAGAGRLHGASKRHLDATDGAACGWPDGAAAGIGVYGVLVVQHVLCGVLDFWHNRPVPPALGCSGDDCPGLLANFYGEHRL